MICQEVIKKYNGLANQYINALTPSKVSNPRVHPSKTWFFREPLLAAGPPEPAGLHEPLAAGGPSEPAAAAGPPAGLPLLPPPLPPTSIT